MRYFRDTGILFLGASSLLILVGLDRGIVLAMLETVILICGSYFFDSKYIKAALWTFFSVSLFVTPEMIPFCPVLSYILMKEERVPEVFISCLWTAWIIAKIHIYLPMETAGLIVGELISLIFANDANKYDKMYFETKRIKDDSEERELLLAEKNKALQEKQNYEIYAATLRERNRIAREIHDNVGHLLTRTILLTGAAKAVNQDKNMKNLLDSLENSLSLAMNSIRESVHDLHDESESLIDIIKGIIKDFDKCELKYDMSEIIPIKTKYCFAAIIKEALSNTVKHSDATSVKIVLREHPAFYQLWIEDNGQGFAKNDTDHAGIGLKNMQERVMTLGGTLQINGENGFRIFVSIPKQQDQNGKNEDKTE